MKGIELTSNLDGYSTWTRSRGTCNEHSTGERLVDDPSGTKQRSTATIKTVATLGTDKPLPPADNKEEYAVEFKGADDPAHPQNWRFLTKYTLISLRLHHYANHLTESTCR